MQGMFEKKFKNWPNFNDFRKLLSNKMLIRMGSILEGAMFPTSFLYMPVNMDCITVNNLYQRNTHFKSGIKI